MVKLAGLGDTSVLCKLTNEDGTMALLSEVINFAKKHGITFVTIENIFQYRKQIAANFKGFGEN